MYNPQPEGIVFGYLKRVVVLVLFSLVCLNFPSNACDLYEYSVSKILRSARRARSKRGSSLINANKYTVYLDSLAEIVPKNQLGNHIKYSQCCHISQDLRSSPGLI